MSKKIITAGLLFIGAGVLSAIDGSSIGHITQDWDSIMTWTLWFFGIAIVLKALLDN